MKHTSPSLPSIIPFSFPHRSHRFSRSRILCCSFVVVIVCFDTIITTTTILAFSVCLRGRIRSSTTSSSISIGSRTRGRSSNSGSDTVLSLMMTTTTSTTDTNKERSIPATESTPTSTATQTPLAQYGLPGPLLLGSASFTRKLILNEMGIPYKKFVRPINEKLIGTRDGGGASQPNPTELVLLVAHAKMDRLVHELQQEEPPDEIAHTEQQQGCVVLTGDQVVLCQNTILEKPDSVAEAQNMVAMYVTHPPSTIGSCVLYHHPSGIRVSGTDTATIHFNATSLGANASSSSSSEGGTTPPPTTTTTIPAAHALITDLLALNQPVLSCAGGLMIEHPLVQRHILSIEGTEDSVMGLSKQLVLTLFEELQAKLAAARTQDEDEPCN